MLLWRRNITRRLLYTRGKDLFTGVLFIYFVHVTVQRPSSFPLNLSHEPLFLCWDHSVAGMKTVELPPTPFSRTNFHASSSSLVPFLIFFFSRTGTVRYGFPAVFIHSPLPTTQTFREMEIKSKWNYVCISKTKPSPPQAPSHLRRPFVNLLTKLVSR